MNQDEVEVVSLEDEEVDFQQEEDEDTKVVGQEEVEAQEVLDIKVGVELDDHEALLQGDHEIQVLTAMVGKNNYTLKSNKLSKSIFEKNNKQIVWKHTIFL
jgi:hypothetical protein